MKNTKSRPATKSPRRQRVAGTSLQSERQIKARAHLARLNHPALKNPFGDVLRSSDDCPFDNSEGLFVHVLVDFPRIKIFRTPDGYLVDRECNDDVRVGARGWYRKPHVRELLSREQAFCRLLVSVVPDEFIDLIKPLALEW